MKPQRTPDVRAAVDPDATLVMPTPGGQATVIMPRPGGRPARSSAGVELQRLVAGINPLLAAASVLLALVAQLRATTSHADPAGLRAQLLERVAEFETLAAANGITRPQITAARYMLCTFIDETVNATPWGAGGVWAQHGLLKEFHDDDAGGDKVFALLEKLGEDPATNADLLELFYVCLALGFEGRYRGAPGGRAQLDAIAERVLEVVRPASGEPAARTLSLRWQGVPGLGRRRLAMLPLWVVFAGAGAVALALVLALNMQLENLARPVFHRIHAVPAMLQADRPAVAAKPRVAPLLAADSAAGALAVRDEALRSVVTLPADALFAAGTARVEPGQQALLGRVATAMKGLPGQVVVRGHTDDATTGSLQFPSGWHLSNARAQAVTAVLQQQGVAVDRLRAEGRADAEPLAPNTTPAQRAQNRRIEIELRLARP